MVALSEPVANLAATLPSVLVIDDERGPRESLRILLKPEYRVFCADSVDAGLALLREHHPDTVIMDIRMPGKNGIEGLRAIREIDRIVSVVMFTGFGALETAQEAIRLGANDYLKKPFDTFEIRAVIQRHVQRTQRDRCRKEAEGKLTEMNQVLTDELERRKHLASLGQKSAELVHDLRNPLAILMGYVELLTDSLKNPQDEQETSLYLDSIQKSVLRCRDLTDMWLDVSRGRLHRVSVDFGVLVRSIVKECSVVAGQSQAQLVADIEAGGLTTQADQVQITRAIQNLVTNALEAVTVPDGRVRVWCRNCGSGIEIGVEDNGCGMTEAQVLHASEPFFSTKKDSGGTGLGLFIARQVVEAHSGTLQITSKPGEGTRITVTLPAQAG